MSLTLSGALTEERQEVRLAGRIADFDLAQMGFVPERLGGSFLLDAEASATRSGSYAARVGLDSIVIRSGYRTDRIRATSLSFAADTASTRIEASSGDLSLRFSSRSPLDSLIAALTGAPTRWHAKSASRRSIWNSCNPCFPTSTCKPQPDGTIS